MYKLVSPQSLMAKRAIPEHRRMTSLPWLAVSEKPTGISWFQMTTTTSVTASWPQTWHKGALGGKFSLYPCSAEGSNC